jgi:hypothetical protein
MDERDPDVKVPLAPLDQRQLGEESFSRDEVLGRRGAGWLWCAVHGPDLCSGQALGAVFSAPAEGAY